MIFEVILPQRMNSILQKKWLGIHSDNITKKFPKIPHDLFGQSAQSDKIFGIFKKKALIGCP